MKSSQISECEYLVLYGRRVCVSAFNRTKLPGAAAGAVCTYVVIASPRCGRAGVHRAATVATRSRLFRANVDSFHFCKKSILREDEMVNNNLKNICTVLFV